MVLDNLILLGNEYILPCVLDMSDTLIFYHLFALEVSGVKRRIAFRKGKRRKKFRNLRFVCNKVVRYHSGLIIISN